MANTIITKNSSTASAVPTSGDLVQGELAVNVTDKRLFTENSGGTVVELGVNPTSITTGNLTASGTVTIPDNAISGDKVEGGTINAVTINTLSAGQANFADNAKAIFGAGSDLQIYHNGGNSLIEETGTGALIIRSNSFALQNAAGNETIASMSENGAVALFFDNGAKLATTATGIDVTGTVVADGLTVDGDVSISSTNSRLRLFETDATDLNTQLQNSAGDFNISTLADNAASSTLRLKLDHATGDISFYEDTGTTPKFFWDASAESLGIGTSSPQYRLDLRATAGTQAFQVLASDFTGFGITSGSNLSTIKATALGSAGALAFATGGGTERMRITSAGNVGIGTSSPATNALLTIEDSTAGSKGGVVFKNTEGSFVTYTDGGHWIVYDMTAAQERVRISSAGIVGLGTTSSGGNSRFVVNSTAVSHGSKWFLNNGQKAASFEVGGSEVGTISVTTTSTAYNTSSDYRLKEDWVAVADASTRVNALKPVNFAWKADGKRVDGFLAHELAEVVPEAVTGEKDAIDAEGKPVYQGIDQSKLVPLLTAALQEALAKIDSLTARVSALEGN